MDRLLEIFSGLNFKKFILLESLLVGGFVYFLLKKTTHTPTLRQFKEKNTEPEASRASSFQPRKKNQFPSQETEPDLLWKNVPPEIRWAFDYLGLDPLFTLEDLQQSYRKRVNEHHPDRFEVESAEIQNLAKEATLKLNEARSLLLKWHRLNGA